jgi:hypothetical protein
MLPSRAATTGDKLNMTKQELAEDILAETEARSLSKRDCPDEIIRDAAVCGECLDDFLDQDQLDRMVAEATDPDHWHSLFYRELERHSCFNEERC